MYEKLAGFAQTWGLIIFVFAFILVLVYAFAPGNRKKFERAREIPLDKDEEADG